MPELKRAERDVDLEAIAANVHNKMLGEIGEPSLTTEEVEAATALDDDTEAKVEPEVKAEPEAKVEPKVEDQVTKQMRKVKVNGQELEVSEDDLVASFRMTETARQEMHRAQQARVEAERFLEEAKTKVAEPPKPLADDERKAKKREYHDALVVGDMEKADELFDQLTAPVAKAADPSELAKQIAPSVKQAVKQELDNESALERFERDYKDITDDPYLVEATRVRVQQQMAEGKTYADALFAAGDATRDWLKSKMPLAAAEQPTARRNEKLEKKAGIDNIPTANSKASSTAEVEETASDYIKSMRKSRGLD